MICRSSSSFILFLIPFYLASDAPEDLSLSSAIGYTIENQLDIKISQLQVDVQAGVAEQQGGPFDPIVGLTGISSEFDDLQNPFIGVKSCILGYENLTRVSVSKTSRVGTSFQIGATIDQIRNPLIFPSPKTDIGTVFFSFDQPLLRNLFNSIDTTTEIASYIDLEAAKYDSLQSMSNRVYETIVKYWDAIGILNQLRINEEAVVRLKKLTDKVQTLIDEDELAKDDIRQPLERIVIRELRILELEQLNYIAIQELKLAMGDVDTNAQDSDWLNLIDSFPPIQPDIIALQQVIPGLTKYAIAYRFDIVASHLREKAIAELLKGAMNSTLPELDLIGSVVKTNFTQGCRANNYISPFSAPKPQYSWSIGVNISYPIYNVEAEGLVQQRQGQRLQAMYNTKLITQNILTALRDAFRNHISLVDQLKKAAESVKLSRQLIEDETRKLPEGFSSLFVLLDFEDRLTNALENETVIYRSYLQNIANIRFLSGTLLYSIPCTNRVEIFDPTTLPGVNDE